MPHAKTASLVVLTICFLTGCTSLEVHRLKTDGTTLVPSGALTYALPKKTISVAATMTLKDCTTVLVNGERKLRMEVDVDVTVGLANEVDETERYYIPYDRLRSAFKEIELTVEAYPNQTLKSFNGTVNDKGGAFLTSTIGSVIKLAALAQVKAAASEDEKYCKKDVRDALSTIAQGRKAIKDSEKKLTDAQVAEYTRTIAQLTSEKLTAKATLVWTPRVTELADSVQGRSAAVRELPLRNHVGKWLTEDGIKWLADRPQDVPSTFVALELPKWAHPSVAQVTKDISELDPSRTIEGLIVREPAIAALSVCRDSCPTRVAGVASEDNVVYRSTVAMPQFGRKLTLPLTNRMLQNTSLEIAMSEDGAISKIAVKAKSTASETVAALGGNADTAKAAIEAHEKTKQAELTAAQNKVRDDNKRISECLSAQESILKLGGVPVGTCQ